MRGNAATGARLYILYSMRKREALCSPLPSLPFGPLFAGLTPRPLTRPRAGCPPSAEHLISTPKTGCTRGEFPHYCKELPTLVTTRRSSAEGLATSTGAVRVGIAELEAAANERVAVCVLNVREAHKTHSKRVLQSNSIARRVISRNEERIRRCPPRQSIPWCVRCRHSWFW